MKKNMLIPPIVIIVTLILVAAAYIIIKPDSPEINNSATSKPFLWKIDGENPSYLFGSIHLTGEDLLTLPDVVEEAIDDADYVFTEIKLDDATAMLSAQAVSLGTGETLQGLLPANVEDKLDNYLETKGLSITVFSSFKIWSVATTITLLDDIQELAVSPSLDQYLWNLGEEKGKIMGGLETVEEQLNIFDSLTVDEQVILLNETLDMLIENEEQGISLLDTMKEAYINGDIEVLHNMLIADYDEENPLDVKLWDQLITDRNTNMVFRIKENITNNPDDQFFFIIGAGHYYGDDGILQLLENDGFTITRVQSS